MVTMDDTARIWRAANALGPIESEIFSYLQQAGRLSVAQLACALKWPLPIVAVAVGVLEREGLVVEIAEPNGEHCIKAVDDHAARSRPLTPHLTELWYG